MPQASIAHLVFLVILHLHLGLTSAVMVARFGGPVCIGAPGPMTAEPNLFDGHYYKEVSLRPVQYTTAWACTKTCPAMSAQGSAPADWVHLDYI